LTVREGREPGRQFAIRPGQEFKVGRSGRSVSIKLLDAQISRCHASFELRNDGLYLTDLGSSNGSFVNEERLVPHAARRVATGGIVRLGAHKLEVELVGFDKSTRGKTMRWRLRAQPLLPQEEFEILDELGSGSMGRVWAVKQKLLDRTVAIKVLKDDFDDEARDSFLAEGRIWCKIDSPYVVRLYDIRIAKGTPYLIMELIQGPSAHDEVERGPMEIGRALRIGEDVARALEAIGEFDIVHRDIKPHNVLLAPDGIAKLSDFGIAKTVDAGGTRTGIAMASISYAAPEQLLNAQSVGGWTDVFGLGATLYHLISGRPPVVCKSARDQLRALTEVVEQPPPPLAELRPECPASVAKLIHRMLDKDPAIRPYPPGKLADEFQRLRAEHYPEPSGEELEATGD
jgi:serine/threonine protein kinase